MCLRSVALRRPASVARRRRRLLLIVPGAMHRVVREWSDRVSACRESNRVRKGSARLRSQIGFTGKIIR